MRRRFLALAAVLVILAGCSSAGRHTASPSTSASGQVDGPNPDVIPPVITPAYVDAVFAVLNHAYGDATRQLVAYRSVTPRAIADLQAIFAPDLVSQQEQQAAMSLQGAINNVRPNPGDGVTMVRTLISASPRCIFAETETSLNDVLREPAPNAASEYYELTRKSRNSSRTDINPTPWTIGFNAAYLTPTSIGNRCIS